MNKTVEAPTPVEVQEPRGSKRLLDPVERISEILFGLIMALTFTCTLSVAESNREDVRMMLVGAIGCNIAWGVVDAVMHILSLLAYRGHGSRILRFIATTNDPERSRSKISEALPPLVSSVLSEEQLEKIRKGLLTIPEEKMKVKLVWSDFKTAFGIFLLVFLSTLPVALPFMFIQQPHLALRISNLIAVVFMFICGWFLAGFGGYNRLFMATCLTLLGVMLVGLTILLGG
ncbi:MAG TPA: VIT1/CCC1 transporter family protein [Chitinophagaceae bacterium]|nr:VIT1/CCC1 transporter family protein [Chitinophagaceae bacterium]